MTSLIITSDYAGVVEKVHSNLLQRNVACVVVDPNIIFDVQISVSSPDGSLLVKTRTGESIEIDSDTRIWLRRASMPANGSFPSEIEQVRKYQARAYRSAWDTVFSFPAVWMNPRSSTLVQDGNKSLQAINAMKSKLAPIPTLLTDNPEEFRRFIRRFENGVAVKSPVPWHGDVAGSSEPYGTYTRRLDLPTALSMADQVQYAPVIVQPYVTKAYELRITVVGEEIFACRIDSQFSQVSMIDWRHYDLGNVRHVAVELDSEIIVAIMQFMNLSNLVFAAIDMIVEPDGAHRFVEANPSGEYGWIESLTMLPISAAITEWLSI